MDKRTKGILEREGFLTHVEEWVHDGWGLTGKTSAEQAAAALLMEARGQDGDVLRGGSAAEYPERLRRIAYEILRVKPLR